jgi:NAD(P)-dependent dehydrogenase (short-subunit alcohol dehydrogenase family)
MDHLPSPFDLTGRVAVVTGGNGGLGLGMAQTLSGLGCTVAVWGRNGGKNDQAIKLLGDKAKAYQVDILDKASINAGFAATLDDFGRVDGMFANAGVIGEMKSFVDRSEQEWDAMLGANLHGVRRCFQVAAKHMIDRAKAGDAFGRLVVTSSVAAIEGAAFNEHYGTSKGAVNALVRALAVELARYGITANAILPGYAESDMTKGLMANDKFVQNVIPRIPLRRFGRPDDYGGIAAYLMSPLSGYQTGTSTVIDGGYTVY